MNKRVIVKRRGAGVSAGAAHTEPFTVGVWASRPNYECGRCAFATLDANGMAIHLRAVHGLVGGPSGEADISGEAATETAVKFESVQDEVEK